MGSPLTAPLLLTGKSACDRDWDFFSGSIKHATLRFGNAFGSRAIGETIEGRWSFKRNGFFNTFITVRRAGEEIDLAVMRREKRDHYSVKFTNGRNFTMRKTKRTSREFGMYDAQETLLVAYDFESKLLGTVGTICIEAAATNLPERPILVLLGWYYLVLRDADESAALTAIVCSS